MAVRYATERGRVAVASARERLAGLERLRRQEFLNAATVTTLILLSTGILPAFYPIFIPALLVWLVPALSSCAAAVLANRNGNVGTAIVLYMFSTVVFYLGAIFAVPAGPHGLLSAQSFASGNLYYFVLGVLPIFAAPLLLDGPWPYLIGVITFAAPQIAIWLLPHPVEFDTFASYIGGRIFLAGSVASGQVMLFAFALAIVRTLGHALTAANRASDLEVLNQRIAERQEMLEADIKILQQAHADIANGVSVRLALQPSSELYPVAVSLNILIERLAKLSRVNHEMQAIQVGLTEASRAITRLSQGDLSATPAPTGTSVDGLLAALIQVQGQIATWVRGVTGALMDVRGMRQQTTEAATDLIIALRQMDELLRQSVISSDRPEVEEILQLARGNAEQLMRLMENANSRDAMVHEALSRITLGNSSRPPLAPPRY